jgi:hypothetical protein
VLLGPGSALTVGVVARAAAEMPAGRGRVVRELLRALAGRTKHGHRYVLADADMRGRLGRTGKSTVKDYAWKQRIDALEGFPEGVALPTANARGS